ncbi:MAG TPA: NUDIX domain-containing protein [Gemmatimonadales bacterium]|jgi:dATP pyrophosphohydrolase|nr:NUDIX domain-containing protein [Gemmatimonadales bacterium]
MTTVRVALVDVYVLRGRGEQLELLLLRRSARGPRAGSWEMVHGHIDPGETPVGTARRELLEETGCTAAALYNLSRVDQFYLHATDEIDLIPVFAAFIADDAVVRVSEEHDLHRWLTPAEAQALCTWPRAVEGIAAVVRLLRSGSAETVEGVLRVD